MIVLRIEVKETTLEIPQESFQDFFKEYLFPNQFLTAASFFIHDAKFSEKKTTKKLLSQRRSLLNPTPYRTKPNGTGSLS